MDRNFAILCAALLCLSAISEEGKVSVEIKDLKAQTALVIKTKVKRAEIGMALAKILPKVGAVVRKNKIEQLSAPMARYVMVDADTVELEGGVIVAAGSKGEGDVVAIELPAGKTAFTVHTGPYEALSKTYDAVNAVLKTKSLMGNKSSWEIYNSDPGNTKPEDIKTEIYIPVTEAK